MSHSDTVTPGAWYDRISWTNVSSRRM